jgi:hypothetical protein
MNAWFSFILMWLRLLSGYSLVYYLIGYVDSSMVSATYVNLMYLHWAS